MTVTTINPVYIGTKRVSPASRYLSFDASNSDEVSAFQAWANSQGYTPALVVDGIAGQKTNKAISKLGSKYDAMKSGGKKLAGIMDTETKPDSSADVTNGGAGTTASGKATGKKKLDLDKAKQTIEKGKGLFDSIKGIFGGGDSTSAPVSTDAGSSSAPSASPTPKQGMSMGKKIAIGLGVAGVIGIIWYATKPKTAKK